MFNEDRLASGILGAQEAPDQPGAIDIPGAYYNYDTTHMLDVQYFTQALDIQIAAGNSRDYNSKYGVKPRYWKIYAIPRSVGNIVITVQQLGEDAIVLPLCGPAAALSDPPAQRFCFPGRHRRLTLSNMSGASIDVCVVAIWGYNQDEVL